MASEFAVRTVGETCAVCDGAHAKVERSPTGVMYLTSKNVRVGRLQLDDVSFISEEDFQRLFPLDARVVRRPLPGDVLMGIIGTFGTAYRVRASDRFGVASAVALLRPDREVLTPEYLYYVVVSPTFRAAHDQYKSGSAQGYTNLPTIRRLPVPVPPLDEQRRIAAVLGALDDKIELNRKMNRTLEEMAQAIFKSWFIDFDGQGDLVDSELGPIPSGWSVGSLSSVAKNIREVVQPRDIDGETPYVGLEHVPRRSASLESWGRAAEADSGKGRFEKGDILFGKLRPYFHKVVPSPVNGVASTDIIVVRPKRQRWRWFTFGHLFSDEMVAHATASSDGTKMPRTKWADLCRYAIAVPPADVADNYQGTASPLFERLWANSDQSRTLATLRDALLPKLMSGEIRVPEAEQAVKAAP